MRSEMMYAAAPLALLAACNQASAPAVDKAAEQAAIEAVENAQISAINAHDAAGMAAPYTADAVLYMPDSAPVSGDAIAGAMAEMVKDEALAVSIDEGSQTVFIADSGDMATTVFTGKMTVTGADGAPAVLPMAVQTLWLKEDGSWKIARDFNMELPAS